MACGPATEARLMTILGPLTQGGAKGRMKRRCHPPRIADNRGDLESPAERRTTARRSPVRRRADRPKTANLTMPA